MQIIYQGKTKACEPKPGAYPDNFDITHSESHWSNEDTKLSLFKNVLKPYVDTKRKEFKWNDQVPALIIYDHHTSNFHPSLRQFCKNENWLYALVPASCTDWCQPMDLSVNKKLKHHLRHEWTKYYSEKLKIGLQNGIPIKQIKVDTTLTTLKAKHAGWISTAFAKLAKDKKTMMRGWELLGLSRKSNDDDEKE